MAGKLGSFTLLLLVPCLPAIACGQAAARLPNAPSARHNLLASAQLAVPSASSGAGMPALLNSTGGRENRVSK